MADDFQALPPQPRPLSPYVPDGHFREVAFRKPEERSASGGRLLLIVAALAVCGFVVFGLQYVNTAPKPTTYKFVCVYRAPEVSGVPEPPAPINHTLDGT